MKSTFKLVFLMALIVCVNEGFCQETRNLKFELYDEDDGLLSMYATSLIQDHNGYLWIGTLDGLNRFDGYSFISFAPKKNDSSSLLRDYIQSLTLDRNGKLWIGYYQGGFSQYIDSCMCFKHYTYYLKNNSRQPVTGTNILDFEGDSAIWYSGKSIGLNRLDLRSKKHEHFDLPFIDTTVEKHIQALYNSVHQMHRDNFGNAWLATSNGLYLFHINERDFDYRKAPASGPKLARSDAFSKLFPDNGGLWLVGNVGGINFYDITTQKFTTYKYDRISKAEFSNEIDAIIVKNEHEFWISAEDSGLGVFNKQTRSYYFPKSAQTNEREFNTQKLRALLFTKDSVLFAANNFGLLKITPERLLFNFKTLPIKKGENADHFFVSTIVEDTNAERIYFGTMFANGLNILDVRNSTFSTLKVEPNPNKSNNYQMVRSIVAEASKKIWVASPYFIYNLENGNKLTKIASSDLIPDRKSNEYFKNLFPDNEGKFWIQTNHGGLHYYDREQNKIDPALTKRPGYPTSVNFVCFDNNNRAWLTTDTSVFFYDKKNNTIQQFTNPRLDSLTRNGIFKMTADVKGNIWLGIEDFGLVKISYGPDKELRINEITHSNGLPDTKLFNIGADPSGNIWIATKLGVFFMKTDPVSFSLFNSSVGMEKNTFDMAFINGGNNSFYITASGKYAKVNETSVNATSPAPRVYIDNFKVLNASRNFEVNSSKPVVLKPAENFFSIEFGCINFFNQSYNQFAYKLEGWDEEWVYCGKRRYANYTNLDGGEYTFKVKVSNSIGQWGDPVSMQIVIESPFYKKTWFIIMAALILSGIVYAIYLTRIGEIEKTEKLKTEFNKKINETRLQALRAQMNPHFIFNSLNSINRYVIKNDVKVASYYITKFSKLMRLILDNSEHKKVVLSNELEALKLYIEMEALRFDNKFSFEIEVDDLVSTDRIEIPPLLIQPYVENAIWHGLLHKDGEGKLIIKIRTDDNMLICEVIDNGVGREKAMEYKSKNAPTRKSVGMKLTEERLKLREVDNEEIGSQEIIDLKNEAGEPAGTKVIIKIPI